MIDNLVRFIENFFLHLEINTLNLPYTTKLPRSYGANPLSKLVTRVVKQSLWVRRTIGVNLALAALAVPAFGTLTQAGTQEIPLNIDLSSITTVESVPVEVTTQVYQYQMPVERLRYISTKFSAIHPGYDLNSYIGDDVYAFSSGRVQVVEYGTFGLGRYVVIDHGHGLISVYGHLKDFTVEVGDVVRLGDKIGEVGMTGYTTGPHVHFEVYENNVAVNPGNYLNQ